MHAPSQNRSPPFTCLLNLFVIAPNLWLQDDIVKRVTEKCLFWILPAAEFIQSSDSMIFALSCCLQHWTLNWSMLPHSNDKFNGFDGNALHTTTIDSIKQQDFSLTFYYKIQNVSSATAAMANKNMSTTTTTMAVTLNYFFLSFFKYTNICVGVRVHELIWFHFILVCNLVEFSLDWLAHGQYVFVLYQFLVGRLFMCSHLQSIFCDIDLKICYMMILHPVDHIFCALSHNFHFYWTGFNSFICLFCTLINAYNKKWWLMKWCLCWGDMKWYHFYFDLSKVKQVRLTNNWVQWAHSPVYRNKNHFSCHWHIFMTNFQIDFWLIRTLHGMRVMFVLFNPFRFQAMHFQFVAI